MFSAKEAMIMFWRDWWGEHEVMRGGKVTLRYRQHAGEDETSGMGVYQREARKRTGLFLTCFFKLQLHRAEGEGLTPSQTDQCKRGARIRGESCLRGPGWGPTSAVAQALGT